LLWPEPRQLPSVTVFPAGSIGARTPGALEGEIWGLSSTLLEDPAVEVEAEVGGSQGFLPLNGPLQDRDCPLQGSFELEDGLLQNKFVSCSRRISINVLLFVYVAFDSSITPKPHPAG